jgi:hypothetical protein
MENGALELPPEVGVTQLFKRDKEQKTNNCKNFFI